jgi:probable HAF family extracellular repeat protein
MGIWVAFTRGPFAINDAGQVAGTSAGAGGASRAFIPGADGVGMRDLGALSESNFGSAYGINDSGQVVGQSTRSRAHPMLLSPAPTEKA